MASGDLSRAVRGIAGQLDPLPEQQRKNVVRRDARDGVRAIHIVRAGGQVLAAYTTAALAAGAAETVPLTDSGDYNGADLFEIGPFTVSVLADVAGAPSAGGLEGAIAPPHSTDTFQVGENASPFTWTLERNIVEEVWQIVVTNGAGAPTRGFTIRVGGI